MNKVVSSNQVLQDILSVIKAIANISDVKIEMLQGSNNFFSWNQNCINNKTVLLPQNFDITKSRAAVDLAACYLRFHDAKTHQEFSFDKQSSQQEIFNAFEKIRVIANAKNLYQGVAKNILHKISDDVQSHDNEGFVASHNFPLMLLQEIFSDKEFLHNKKDLEIINAKISKNYYNLHSAIFNNLQNSQTSSNLQKQDKKILSYIKKIAKNINNQEAFAQEVERFLEFLQKEQEAKERQNNSKNQDEENSESKNNEAENDVAQNQENVESIADSQSGEEEQSSEEKLAQEEKKSSIGAKGESLPMRLQSSESSFDEDSIEFKKIYKVYTNKFDEIVLPQKLIGKNQLQLLRDGLDLRLAKLDSVSKKLTIKLKKKLLAKKNSFIEQNQMMEF